MYEISPESYLNQFHSERETAALKCRQCRRENGGDGKRRSILLLFSLILHRGDPGQR